MTQHRQVRTGAGMSTRVQDKSDASDLYLDLMQRCLTGWIYADLQGVPFDEGSRLEGRDWPAIGHTMVGFKRLENLRTCVEDVIDRQVPGDLIETGVWRGGSTIFMRAIL